MRSFVITHVNVEILDDEELARYSERVTIDGIEFAVMRSQTLDDTYKHPFRLLDGDGIVYFIGLSAIEDDFNPIDYYGIDYGCVWIQYKNANDEWETCEEDNMARFSSFITTERNSEISRLGNKEISSKTFATETSVKVTATVVPAIEKKKVINEKVWVEIMNGHSQYFHGVIPFFTIEDGLIKIPESFMEMVEKYNNELIERRRAVENLK